MTQFHVLLSSLFLILSTVFSQDLDSRFESVNYNQKKAYESLETSSLSKGEVKLTKRAGESGTFALMVDSLVRKLEELGLESSINESYFAELKRKALEKELEIAVNCKCRIFTSHFNLLANIAYRGKGTNAEIEISQANEQEGQIHGFVYEDPTGFVFLGVISGSGEWLPGTIHSAKLAYGLKAKSREIFSIHHSERLSPQKYLEKSWESIESGAFIGGVTALYVTINPGKRIEVANLGKDWAGLYRDGKLVASTSERVHQDGTVYHLCKTYGIFKPKHCKDNVSHSLKLSWQARAHDELILVSKSVREVLSPAQIYDYSTKSQDFLAGNDQFFGASVGIIQGARSFSSDTQNTEKIAIALKLV